MELLNDPRKLYEEAKTPARKVLNKAIFTKLYVDDLGDHIAVTGDELNEPFATVIYARRAEAGMTASSAQQATQEAIQAAKPRRQTTRPPPALMTPWPGWKPR